MQPPPQPPPYPQYPPPPPDGSRRFLNMSGGFLALVIGILIISPIALCFICTAVGAIGSIFGSTPGATPTPTP